MARSVLSVPGSRGASRRRGRSRLHRVLRSLCGGGSVLLLVAGLLTLPLLVPSAHAATISDNFNRANGGLGSNWTTVTGTAAPQIVNNTAQPGSAGTLNSAYWSANTFGSNRSGCRPASPTALAPIMARRSRSGSATPRATSSGTATRPAPSRSGGWTAPRAGLSSRPARSSPSPRRTLRSSGRGWLDPHRLPERQAGRQLRMAPHYTTGAPGIWMYYAGNQITNSSGGDVATTPTYSGPRDGLGTDRNPGNCGKTTAATTCPVAGQRLVHLRDAAGRRAAWKPVTSSPGHQAGAARVGEAARAQVGSASLTGTCWRWARRFRD